MARRPPSGVGPRPVTIIEVAAAAGVSKSTVSNVIRRADNVTPSTRDRVLAAIEDLGYRPNVLARQLKERRSTMIGVLVGDLANPFYAELAQLVERHAADAGYSVMFCNVEGEDHGTAGVEALLQQQIAGILFLASADRRPVMRKLLARTVPTVFVGLRGEWGDSVAVDDGPAAATLTEHLLSLGHRRIAYVTTAAVDRGADRARGGGYLRAMRAAALEPLPFVHWRPGELDARVGRSAILVADLVGGDDPVTALFASNDLAAVALLDLADRLRVRVPRDLSIAGFDDIALSALGRISLTTMSQPLGELARLGIELVVGRATGRLDAARRVRLTVPTELVVRTSTARPRRPAEAAVRRPSIVGG